MWIRTQDKKELVKVIKVEITHFLRNKKNKIVVFGSFAPQGLFSSNGVVLGVYSTLENAIAEINEIEKCILNNPNGVYSMRSNL